MEEPTRRLAPAARAYWTLGALSWGIPAVVGAWVAAGALGDAEDVPGPITALGPWLVVLAVGWSALLAPQLRWRRWRWELRDEELDLRHGVVRELRTVVPVARVQHVETERTFWGQAFALATLRVHTAAGPTEVPALALGEAEAVRDRLARLARVPEDV